MNRASGMHPFIHLVCCFLIMAISSCSSVPSTQQVIQVSDSDTPTPTNGLAAPLKPSLTSSPVPTNSRVPKVDISRTAEFSDLTANKELPPDILREVGYFVGGGGAECGMAGIQENFRLAQYPSDGELMEAALFIVCGWQDNEKVKASVEMPDGKIITKELVAERNSLDLNEVSFWYIPHVNDPPGEYQFLLQGDSGELKYSAFFKRPHGPRLYELDHYFAQDRLTWREIAEKTRVSYDKLFFYDFRPNEIVKLIAYQDKPGYYNVFFYAWQEYQTDSNGQLMIDLDIDTIHFMAVGEFSGEVGLSEYNPFGKLFILIGNEFLIENQNDQSNQTSSCPGAPPQQVNVDDRGYVCTKSDKLIVREEPKRESDEVTRISPGTEFKIVDGPSCSNDWSWWKIKTKDGFVGWVAEGGDSIDPYFICPAK